MHLEAFRGLISGHVYFKLYPAIEAIAQNQDDICSALQSRSRISQVLGKIQKGRQWLLECCDMLHRAKQKSSKWFCVFYRSNGTQPWCSRRWHLIAPLLPPFPFLTFKVRVTEEFIAQSLGMNRLKRCR